MFLVDSNIIVYSNLPQYEYLRNFFIDDLAAVSEISRVEMLGYHKLTSKEERYFKNIFDFVTIITPSPEIFNTAITIRKNYNLKLGDSIIAATAIIHDMPIYTRNLKDFNKIHDLNCIDSIKL